MTLWNVKGKTVIVTGATSGIGFAAALDLARQGAHVVMVGRDRAKTEAAVAAVKKQPGATEVSSLLCDFSRQASIHAFAEQALRTLPRIDVLVNNAGTAFATRTVTEDGIEATFAVNHLGYYLTTRLLLDRIVASAPARIVNVASTGHYRGTMDFSDLGFTKGYSIMRAYSRSKLANVMFTHELARRLAEQGVMVNALHPGAVDTNIWSYAPGWAKPILQYLARPFFISAAQGAQTIVHLAASAEMEHVTGKYFEKNRPVAPNPLSLDVALQKRLWDVSAEMVKLPA